MEKSAIKTVPEESKKVVHSIERVNLHDFGYEKSGNVKGDPEVYASYLERIINGDLVEESNKGISESEKKEKKAKIEALQKELDEINEGNKKTEEEIDAKEKRIDDYREELVQINEKRDEDRELAKRESFSSMKFSINLIILLMLTVYLFFFYVSAAFKALYTDFEQIANNIAEGIGTGSIMPSPLELSEAIRYNYLLFLVPFVFYAFGWAFHILIELKHKLKILFVSLLIAVTFTVDFLLALIIHQNTETAKELMGLETIKWSQSSTFYIILFLGFLVYVIWSILLDSLIREWSKRQIKDNIKKIIKHLRGDIKRLQEKLVPTEDLKVQINYLIEDISTVMQGNLKRYVDQFSTGWISYLSPDSMKDVKVRCLSIKKDVEDKYAIKPGEVKVFSKRK
jgi:Fe2+ transport system protein B